MNNNVKIVALIIFLPFLRIGNAQPPYKSQEYELQEFFAEVSRYSNSKPDTIETLNLSVSKDYFFHWDYVLGFLILNYFEDSINIDAYFKYPVNQVGFRYQPIHVYSLNLHRDGKYTIVISKNVISELAINEKLLKAKIDSLSKLSDISNKLPDEARIKYGQAVVQLIYELTISALNGCGGCVRYFNKFEKFFPFLYSDPLSEQYNFNQIVLYNAGLAKHPFYDSKK